MRDNQSFFLVSMFLSLPSSLSLSLSLFLSQNNEKMSSGKDLKKKKDEKKYFQKPQLSPSHS